MFTLCDYAICYLVHYIVICTLVHLWQYSMLMHRKWWTVNGFPYIFTGSTSEFWVDPNTWSAPRGLFESEIWAKMKILSVDN